MILYDDKYNFLGMSSETLGFLGYEDINEFLSLNSDVANLFVRKEGFIYNFENFSWIDFVLFSGSANKSALITLKNGQETKVDLSIKEVHLANEMNGIRKMYGVKLISENFHEISGVAKQESPIKGAIGGFTLGEVSAPEINKEPEPIAEEVVQQESFEQAIEASKEQVSEPVKNDSFILNFSEDALKPKEEIQETPVETVQEESSEEFKLDLFKTDTPQEVQTETKEITPLASEAQTQTQSASSNFFTLDTQTPTEDAVNETDEVPVQTETFNFDALKTELSPQIETEQTTEQSTPQESIQEETPFTLNFLKLPTEEHTPQAEAPLEIQKTPQVEEESLKLDFLKQDASVEEISQKFEAQSIQEEETQPSLKLDFLSVENIQEEETPQVTEPVESTPEETKPFTLNFLQNDLTEVADAKIPEIQTAQDKATIIEQIKQDIQEIDAGSNAEQTVNETESALSHILDIPETPQVEQPLQLHNEPQPSKPTDTPQAQRSVEEDTTQPLSNFQIEETKTLDKNRSFTSTLKGLFGKKESDMSAESSEEMFEFKLKHDNQPEETESLSITETEEEESPLAFIKEQTPSTLSRDNTFAPMQEEVSKEPVPIIQELIKEEVVEESEAEISFPPLTNLGLTQEETFDLIADFITDAKESQTSIEQFITANDFDKINYSLVKIKSSAEILNLDAIISISNSMREHCITKDTQKVTADVEKLKAHITLLERHLEETAV
ncbi:MAG: hypothetical protein K0U47_00535 [Epsilonproteobacteria bacterium]|nr:hypothetical protein [Campylobacterota bacterium]